MNMRRIGIMGGTFDPVHIGHLIMAQSALTELKLDRVIFMPSGNPPHKELSRITDAKIRSEMVKLAIDKNDKFVYSDFELKRDGIVYTADTLRMIRERDPDMELYFIVGADSLLDMEKWHEPEKVFDRCRVVVVDRNQSHEDLMKKIRYLTEKYQAQIDYIPSPLVDISSTEIRSRVSAGRSIRYLVTEAVEAYIYEKVLYS